MLLSQPPTLLSLLLTILSTTHTINARPNPPAELKKLLESRYHYLAQRSCANPCGWTGQLCCESGQTCGTNSQGQAVCNVGGGGAGDAAQAQVAQGWEYYTTTYVETDLVTRVSTYSSFFGSETAVAAPAPTSGSSCDSSIGESPCGGICCATGQYCAYAGQCAASNGHGDESSSAYLGQITTATNSAPLRPTSNAATTITSTGSATTTVPFQTPSASASAAAGSAAMSTTSNNGLSGGAIAGIVVGVIIGLIILILILLCCCAASAADAILGFFGIRNKKRRRETTVIEEHRHHEGGGRRWFGAGPARRDRSPKKSGGKGGLGAVAGGLAGLAVILGLKRKHDKKVEKSHYTGSSYYSDYYSSQSEYSQRTFDDGFLAFADSITGSDSTSDRYTRRSGRSGRSRR